MSFKVLKIALLVAVLGVVAVLSAHADSSLPVTENVLSEQKSAAINSVKTTDNNQQNDVFSRKSRSLLRLANSLASQPKENNLLKNAQKSEPEPNYFYVIPQIRPGRSITKNENWNKRYTGDMIPTLRFGRSDSMIPSVRFGKSDNSNFELMNRRSGEMVPTLRFGRSNSKVMFSANEPTNSEIRKLDKRSADLIPTLRFGRMSSDRNSMIPTLRVGRSDSLIPSLRFGKSADSQMQDKRNEEMIPMLRFGKASDSMIPTIRFGRSKDFHGKRTDSIIPSLRFGRSDLGFGDFSDSAETVDSGESSDEIMAFGGDASESDVERNGVLFEAFESESKRNVDENMTMIPYPRLGRDADSDDRRNSTNDSLIPQIRYGKAVVVEKPSKTKSTYLQRKFKDESITKKPLFLKISDLSYVPPAVRNTRSDIGGEPPFYNTLDEFLNTIFGVFRRSGKQHSKSGKEMTSMMDTHHAEAPPSVYPEDDDVKEVLSMDEGSSVFIIPYPRPGKRGKFEAHSPFGSFPISTEDSHSSFYAQKEKDEDAKDDSDQDFEKNVNIIPFPRPGRSDLMLPHPRFGRSDSIVPQLRFGRSTLLLPYPRPGRSGTIVPFPRPGRSETILPYPRPGRSETMVPFPRPGRTSAILGVPSTNNVIRLRR